MKEKSLFALTWPLFIELLLFMTLGFIDVYMLSKFSDLAVGAVGTANQIAGFLNLVFMVISSGGAVMLAQTLGAKKLQEADQVMIVSIVTNFIFGLAISIMMLFLGDYMLLGMGMTPDLMPYGSIYMKIVGGTIFLQALLSTLSVIIRTHGFTRQTMYISLLMNVLNLIGDAISVYGPFGLPVWGVKGVAIATALSRLIALVVMIYFVFKKILKPAALGIIFRFPIQLFKQLLKIGLPSAGENISFNLTTIALTALLFHFLGQETVIARTYISSIYLFAIVFSNAIGQSTQIMIGHLVGAKQFDKAYHTCLYNFKVGFILSALSGLVMLIFRVPLMGIFTQDPSIIEIGALALLIDAFLEPGRAFNLVLINGLRGAGDVVYPVVVGIIMGWGFRIGLGFILGIVFKMGLAGFILASLFDEWLRGFAMLLRWKSRKWIKKVVV